MINNNDLQFVTKRQGGQHPQGDIDVSVTLVHNRASLAMSFSHKALAMMGDTDYISAAKKSGRIYLKPSNQIIGFKLTGKKDCARKTVVLPADALGVKSENWIGYYRLQWDRERELFYIDINLREE